MSQLSTTSPGRRLRDAWTQGAVQVPGVFNALVARMAERAGFQAVYLSGAALSAAAGVPDVGLLTLTEFVEQARTITLATPLPLLCDPRRVRFVLTRFALSQRERMVGCV